MKTKWILLLILVLLAFPAGSNAWASRDPLGEGTWINRDPMSETGGGGSNLYQYCLNDPIDLTDPLGLCPCEDDCKAKAQEALRRYLVEAAAIGAGLGGAGQTANKSDTKPRGGVAGGGRSGSYTSYSRTWSGGKTLGRTPIPIVMAGGAAVGVATLEAIIYYYYSDCMAHCKDAANNSPPSPTSPAPTPPAPQP